ncbi:MAG: ATP-dependent sacrificial sulfur transferase LarE [Candidatus Omnitrophica bacterium]|nr:ATP-dependent sacrificial sulfur transferase LarE [Candidatus Omnitrophota bacterium]
MNKLSRLKQRIRDMGSMVVAFSAGVDSSFLLHVASEVLPTSKLLAVTANSETYPKEELRCAKEFAKTLGVRHRIIRTHELREKRFRQNPLNRCYFCKKELFSQLKKIARRNKLNYVVDASNVSDKNDIRPGSIAKHELGVCSPLQEAGFTKEDIRRMSQMRGLATAHKPSLACLASRIPYGVAITPRLLKRINAAELYVKGLGFKQVRVRHYNGLCRIEVDSRDIPALIKKRAAISTRLKSLGYQYVTIDLEGYRTGSMNEGVKT